MNKLFWKYFGKFTFWTTTVCLTLLTLTVLGTWFTDLSFPYYIFQWDSEDRASIFWTTICLVGLCAMFGYMQADNESSRQEHKNKFDSLTTEEQEEYLEWLEEYNRTRSSAPAPIKTKRGLDVIDIAVGVASGAVIGEVINDWLD